MNLRLRELRLEDEPAFVAGHKAMAAEGFTFGLGYEPGMPWTKYLAHRAAQQAGRDLPDGFVASTFLVADVDDQIVGRSSIRHEIAA